MNGIPDGTLFTVSPEVYEVGIPDSGSRFTSRPMEIRFLMRCWTI